eukprot:2048200-Prymnesium_polylepis.1
MLGLRPSSPAGLPRVAGGAMCNWSWQDRRCRPTRRCPAAAASTSPTSLRATAAASCPLVRRRRRHRASGSQA